MNNPGERHSVCGNLFKKVDNTIRQIIVQYDTIHGINKLNYCMYDQDHIIITIIPYDDVTLVLCTTF